MNMFIHSHPSPEPSCPAAARRHVREAIGGIVIRWREQARARAAMRAISELSEATRRDLGLAERELRLPTRRSTHGENFGSW